MIKCIMIDFDDTIYDFSTAIKETLFYMIRQGGLNYKCSNDFFYELKEHYLRTFFQVNNSLDIDEYIVNDDFLKNAFDYYYVFSNILSKYSSNVISRKDFEEYFFSHCVVFDNIIQGLKKLKSNGVVIVLLSDGLLNDKTKILEYLELQELFYGVVTSEQIHRLKPSPKFFETVQKKFNFNLNEYIYVGNHISDYLMSKKSGIEFYSFNADEKIKDITKKFTDILS